MPKEKMKKIAILLWFVAGFAEASNWQLVGVGSTASVYVDADSMATSGKYKKAWIKYSFAAVQESTPFTNFKKWQSSTDLIYFDCAERTSGTLQSTYYSDVMSSGEVVSSTILKLSQVLFNESAPDTLGDALISYVCKPGNNKRIKSEKA